jgi:subtilisin-like proprotein convertase family protein
MAGGEAADRSPQTVIVFVRDMEFNSLPDAEVEMLFGKDGAVKPVVLPDGSYMATGTGEKVGVSILHPTAGGASVSLEMPANLPTAMVLVDLAGDVRPPRVGSIPSIGMTVSPRPLQALGPGPANDDCAAPGGPLAVPSLTSGSTIGATVSPEGAAFCGTSQGTGGDVWYTVIGTGNAITASTCFNDSPGSADYDTKITVWCGDCDTLQCVAGNDDSPNCGLPDFLSTVTWCSTPGAEYRIMVHGFGSATGSFELSLADAGPCMPSDGCPIAGSEGACCLPDGTCAVLSEVDCGLEGGTYQGDGTDCGGGGGGTIMEESSPGAAIPDNNASGVVDTITVAQGGTIADVNIDLNVEHTFFGDFCVSVEHNGVTVDLIQRPGADNGVTSCHTGSPFGCSSNDFDLILDDEGLGGPVEDLCGAGSGDPTPPSPPNYTPFSPLSAFDGMDPSGDWTITVADNAGGDTGTFVSWSLHIEVEGGGGGTPTGACCLPDASCVVTTEACCDNAGGFYQGDDSSCMAASSLDIVENPGVLIPEDGTTSGITEESVVIADDLVISDLDVDLIITHTFIGDLEITITHENTGTSVLLRDNEGGAANDLDVVYDDEGVAPLNPLSAFDGESTAGTWTLLINDTLGGDSGVLDQWSLHFSGDATATGACCLPDGSCNVATEVCCDAAGGDYQGDGTDCGGAGTGTVNEYSSSPGIPIPAGGGTSGNTTDSLVVGDSFPIADLDVGVNLAHTFIGDLEMTLTHDDTGTSVLFNDQACGSENDMDVVWDDEGDPLVCAEPLVGTFTPASADGDPLSAFDGEDAAGTWTLSIDDLLLGDSGTLNSWTLFIEESTNPCPLVVSVDIKPGSCPNPLNRNSNGVIPVGLLGDADFDVTEVDISSIVISRADGVGGSVGPNEGPPGPHTVVSDVGTPFDGDLCDCHELEGDGIMDLNMKFRTQDVVDALMLDGLAPGDDVELVISGVLMDGTEFEGSDCVRLVPPVPASMSVTSNATGAWISMSPLDLWDDGGGFADFGRVFVEQTAVTLTAAPTHDGRVFLGWRINGGPLIGEPTIPFVANGTWDQLEAVYYDDLDAVNERPVGTADDRDGGVTSLRR